TSRAEEGRAQQFLIHRQEGVHVVADAIATQLVHLETRSLDWRRPVLVARQGVPEPDDTPASRRWCPVERAVGSHLRREIDDVTWSSNERPVNLGSRLRVVVDDCREARLLFEPVDER